MRAFHVKLAAAVVAVIAMGAGAVAAVGGGPRNFREDLNSYQEVPSVSTAGFGHFEAQINSELTQITYTLTASSLSSDWAQAHIHFAQRAVNGGIVVFLCSNLGNGPVGTQACPTAGGTITGTIGAANVGAGASAQGIAAGEFAELVAALRAGRTYVNVHTSTFGGGEIRAQLGNERD